MYTYTKSIGAKIIIGVVCVLFVVVSSGLINPGVARAQGVPIDTKLNYHSIMDNLKDFALDRIATAIAKQILHQMTMSVVNWINSGFNGSPAFLTNPEAYFLDVADQLTGEFITTGPLRGLCSPFGIDVRLAIASGQTGYGQWERRYTCTLGTIIKNVQKGATVNVDVVQTRNGATLNDIMNGNILDNSQQLSINGQSANQFGESVQTASGAMDEFMSGDFRKGGFPALYSVILEPQNSYYGAYLWGNSDLMAKQAQKEAAINQDLDRGGGFLSWKNCQTLQTVSSDNYNDTTAADETYNGNSNVSKKLNSDGSTSYQECSTATPGSVIAGSVNKAAGVGQDELVAADDINAVVNALISQLMTTMLQGGLSALSGGGNSSYVSRASSYDNNPYIMGNQSLGGDVDVLQSNVETYDEAVLTITNTRDNYVSVRSCFVGVQNSVANTTDQRNQINRSSYSNVAAHYIANIDSALSTYIDPMLKKLKQRQTMAAKSLAQAQGMTSDVAIGYDEIIPDDSASIQEKLDQRDAYVQNAQNIVSGGIGDNPTAQKDLESAKSQATLSDKTIYDYQRICNALVNGSYSSSNNYGGFWNN